MGLLRYDCWFFKSAGTKPPGYPLTVPALGSLNGPRSSGGIPSRSVLAGHMRSSCHEVPVSSPSSVRLHFSGNSDYPGRGKDHRAAWVVGFDQGGVKSPGGRQE